MTDAVQGPGTRIPNQRRTALLAAACHPTLGQAALDRLVLLCGGGVGTSGWAAVGGARRVLPLLADRHDLDMPEALREAASIARTEAWGLNLRLTDGLAPVLADLESLGVTVMTIKGAALAGDCFGHHSRRAIGDVDLLVRPHDRRALHRVLTTHGWRRPDDRKPALARHAQEWIRPGACTIDVHVRWGRDAPPVDEALWERAVPWAGVGGLASTAVVVPSPADHLLVLATHVADPANAVVAHCWSDVHHLLCTHHVDGDDIASRSGATLAAGRAADVLAWCAEHLGTPTPDIEEPTARVRRREEMIRNAQHDARRREPGARGAARWALDTGRAVAGSRGRTRAVVEIGALGLAAGTRRLVRRADLGAVLTVVGSAQDGARVVVLLHGGAVALAELRRRWPPLGLDEVRGDATDQGQRELELAVDLRAGGAGVTVDGDPVDGGWDAVESTLGLFAAAHLRHHVAVHAATFVVDGTAVVVPGSSFAGKSRLAAAAMDLGFEVLGDEYALVDPENGTIAGWPRPLRLRRPDGSERRAVARCDRTFRVGLVAVVHHDPATGTCVRAAAPGEAVLSILANTVCAATRPDDSLTAALAMTGRADALTGTRGEADEAVTLLAERVRRSRG